MIGTIHLANDDFFREPAPGSAVKGTIVSKYFWAWAKVLYNKPGRQEMPLQYWTSMPVPAATTMAAYQHRSWCLRRRSPMNAFAPGEPGRGHRQPHWRPLSHH